MTYRIMQLSDLALQLLKNKQNGVIHSVYRKTINMNIDGSLLALQSCRSPLSPISLLSNLDEKAMEELDIDTNTPVEITDTSVIIGSSVFYYDSAEVFPCELNKILSPLGIKTLKKNVETVLSSSRTGGFDVLYRNYRDRSIELPSLLLEGARNYLSQAYHCIQNGNDASSSVFLARLIGLGTGLTPSGDDFLCGMLAGLILTGKSDSQFAEILKETIQDSLTNTNDISRAFLLCALEGKFSTAVNSLTEVPDPAYISSAFHEIGHSSGMDTLCGILFSLYL